MNAATLARLGVKHLRGHVAEEVLARTGRDFTKPIIFNCLVEGRCNIKCRYCDCWRQKEHDPELSIEQWQQALLEIKKFVGCYSISFTGGEPFLKPGFLDLLAWCRRHGIYAGVTTNGTFLTEKNVAALVGSKPLNVNISLDAADAGVNDYLRGRPGLFETISAGIQRLVRERRRSGVQFPIIIKPTVNTRNFRHLAALVEWTQKIGATCINLQPMDRWTPETYDELWIEESEISELKKVCNALVELKKRGAPILNNESSIRLMVQHFREAESSATNLRCGLRNFLIYPNGDIQICSCSPVVGNIQNQTAREIWYGPDATRFRCGPQNGCTLNLNTSATEKTLVDKLKMGCLLLFGSS